MISFKYETEQGDFQLEVTTLAISHPELVTQFVQFLRGCGYVIDADEYIDTELADEV